MDSSGKSSLLIDDDPNIRLGLKTLLQRNGYQVAAEADGQVVIIAITERAFDLVIMDVFLPHMNGRDCIHAMKESRPELPVIILTGNPESAVA